MKRLFVLVLGLLVACSTTPPSPEVDLIDLQQQVWDTEVAFAATMAARDHDAFRSFLSDDAIFFSDGAPLHGKDAVAAAWKSLFDGPTAPFSWEPDVVEVLASGELALSTGPVTASTGESLGRFTSIWRLQPDGWRIVFDKGDGG
jgi:ketosteroid isomerase-like protein